MSDSRYNPFFVLIGPIIGACLMVMGVGFLSWQSSNDLLRSQEHNLKSEKLEKLYSLTLDIKDECKTLKAFFDKPKEYIQDIPERSTLNILNEFLANVNINFPELKDEADSIKTHTDQYLDLLLKYINISINNDSRLSQNDLNDINDKYKRIEEMSKAIIEKILSYKKKMEYSIY